MLIVKHKKRLNKKKGDRVIVATTVVMYGLLHQVHQERKKHYKRGIQRLCRHKHTYKKLAEKYDCRVAMIQKYLDTVAIHQKKIVPTSVILLIDTTYF